VQVWVVHKDFSWVSDEHSNKEEIHLMAPSPEEVYNLVDSLLLHWRSNYRKLLNVGFEAQIEAIADFHHNLLAIHPFLDGNGRLARAILQQQIIELLNRRLSANFTEERINYIKCLMSADDGDLKPLVSLIKANLE
jgi:Fic family protein